MGHEKEFNRGTGKTEAYSFQVDLKGIIRLLSENLYSSTDVFLRELLQNAVDAIEARRVEQPEFTQGNIQITYHRQEKGRAKLVFSDNGIGLSREEISYGELLEEPDKKMKQELGELVIVAGHVLKPFGCGAVLKQFEPAKSPTLYVAGADAFLDSMFANRRHSEFLEGFDFGNFGTTEDEYGTKLYLNENNPMLRRLAQVQDKQIVETMIKVLYVQSMLAGHYSLGEREMEILHTGLIALMEYGLKGKV